MNFLIIGAGFSGSVLARSLVDTLPESRCTIWDERSHIGGNCHTERDAETGVMVHRYGPHIFNTDNERVWDYVQRFGDFKPFTNRVKAVTSQGVFTLPINLLTINQFFGKTLGPLDAENFVTSLGDKAIIEPVNFEEQALKMLGRDLYEAFFKGYTIKQWGCDPKELPASVLKRLPVRFNYDDNYYSKRFQGIPAEGYSSVIAGILDHPRITVHLNRTFSPTMKLPDTPMPDHIFYTGPIDAFFGFKHGRLGYRTVTFEQIDTDAEDYQGNAVINYTQESIPWTRIHEHKHFAPWEKHARTVAFREFSKETSTSDIPYYPKRLESDKRLLSIYRADALRREGCAIPCSFLGRLATYRYMDMEAVIGEALDFSHNFVEAKRNHQVLPIFPNNEQL